MSKPAAGTWLPSLEAPAAEAPRYVQLYRRIRAAILEGSLKPGTRLPSTRTLAGDLGVSRTTTELAFSQLDAEGYLQRRVGDGTYVAQLPSEGPLRPPPRKGPAPASRRTLSRRGRVMAELSACHEPTVVRAFTGGLPALDHFPLETWNRLLARRARLSGQALLGYGEAAGYRPLREAVAGYLAGARGVVCRPEQVVILTSSQQALDLAARLLLDPGDDVWLENPGYPGARSALVAAGARIVAVPVDGEGIDVAEGCARAPEARLAYVTPSHQYPTGATLSLERRLALLDWAERAGAWLIEDDYDSEFRYAGRPIAAIQGLAGSRRVLYVGTFSKVLFPSIRLAYLVAPDDLVEAFVTARMLSDGHTPQLMQAVVADFITEGHFGAHLRRMRGLYRERRDVLLETAGRELRNGLDLGPADAGLHVAGYLPPGRDDVVVSRRAEARGLAVPPLSRYHVGPGGRPGLLVGYGGLAPAAIRRGLRLLAGVLP